MSKELTKLPAPQNQPRVETGPIQFGEDWPGIFLRGDYAIPMAMYLDYVLKLAQSAAEGKESVDMMAIGYIEMLKEKLSSCQQ